MNRSRIAHFVYGFRPQTEPFPLMHYIAIESCRQVVQPDRILVHCRDLPWGEYWDLIRPHVELLRVSDVEAVSHSSHDEPDRLDAYRYAHHADFVRLDALIEYGGLYADIDTVFLRPIPDDLWDKPFVIGSEGDVADPRTGELRPSLCNALMLCEPRSPFAVRWLDEMAGALDGTWSAHSGYLSRRLADEMPADVEVVDPGRFFPVLFDPASIDSMLHSATLDLGDASSMHLWAHLWWDRNRTDLTQTCSYDFSHRNIEHTDTALAGLLRPYLPTLAEWPLAS